MRERAEMTFCARDGRFGFARIQDTGRDVHVPSYAFPDETIAPVGTTVLLVVRETPQGPQGTNVTVEASA
jgi:hypothetical protein